MKSFWLKNKIWEKRPLSRRNDIEGSKQYKKYKNEFRSSRKKSRKGKSKRRSVDLISSKGDRKFYKDLEMDTLDDR